MIRRKEIGFGLMYRDMWQSAGKYMPRVDQLEAIAPAIVEMGCFRRVETNGGGFEQINLLYGENPNISLRKWTAPFRKAGIQTQMLERGLNGLRMSPVPADVREKMFSLKKIQGTDISRSFDGLNDARNLQKSFEYARKGGMIAQGALCITVSPIHTDDYFIKLADTFVSMGAEEICLKDMAGIGRPASIGRITKGIRERHPNMIIQYHGHSTPGFSTASALEAARNGADIIDVGMEPLSWGTGHADLLTIHAMLKDDGFLVPDINMKAYMEARSLTQSFIDDFLGYYIDPKNRHTSSLLIGPGLPGGMMGSLMADLENNLKSLNKWLEKNEKPQLAKDELLLKMFEEVEYIWPMLGYPPLVTPYSQYVKNVALMNAIQIIKGKERWSLLDENTWDMILGNAGQLPGAVHPELVALANAQGKSFFTGDPQDLYPDALDSYRTKMKEKGWDLGPDEEELFEYAMHPGQYEAFKSGQAKEKFLLDLAEKKNASTTVSKSEVTQNTNGEAPRRIWVTVNDEQYVVDIDYSEQQSQQRSATTTAPAPTPSPQMANGAKKAIIAPLEGKLFYTRDSSEKPIKVGDRVNVGDTIAYIEAMKVMNAISADHAGVVTEIVAPAGTDISEDEPIIYISPN